MKIAFVIPRLVRHAGGTEQALAALIEQVALRHEVAIFSSAVVGLDGVPYRFQQVPAIFCILIDLIVCNTIFSQYPIGMQQYFLR